MTTYHIEAAVAEGLEPIVKNEIMSLGRTVRLARFEGEPPRGVVIFDYSGDLRSLQSLRMVNSVYLVRSYPVPRPKALLGDEHLRALLAQIELVRSQHKPGTYNTLYISAAGSESAVMQRLIGTLAERTGLHIGEEDGDLFLRLRRSTTSEGWDVLVRLGPRPLATRAWRVCNLEGALNAAVAHALNWLTQPDSRDTYVNIGCGSGTLLIERLRAAPARRAIGCDTSSEALNCAIANVAAAKLSGRCELHNWDATALPLGNASVDVITSDLPFGHLVGSHNENLALYPALLREAARIARRDACCALLSHEVRLMESLLAEMPEWSVDDIIRVGQGGLYPRIFLLRRV
jgi:tRNA (guanine6-N2)-methyltransferase